MQKIAKHFQRAAEMLGLNGKNIVRVPTTGAIDTTRIGDLFANGF